MQRIKRVYPKGWTGNSCGQLNRLLSEGWEVKFITAIGEGIQDYILEKKNMNEPKEIENENN